MCNPAIVEGQSDGGTVQGIGNGRSLVAMLSMRLACVDHLIDIARLPQLRGIERREQQAWLGAGTTEAKVGADTQVRQRVPLPTRATPFVSHSRIRNRGTPGGSIAHADGEYPVDPDFGRGDGGDARHRFAGLHGRVTAVAGVTSVNNLNPVFQMFGSSSCGCRRRRCRRRRGGAWPVVRCCSHPCW
jgi:hypothetical protein